MTAKFLKISSQYLFISYTIFCTYSFQLCFLHSGLLYANESSNLPFERMIESLGEPFHPFKPRPDLIRENFRKNSNDLIKPVVKPVVAVIPVINHVVPVSPQQPLKKTSAASLPVLKVTGLFYKTRNPMVILNGNILGLGDRSDGVRILAIRKGRVEIDYNGFLYKILLKD